MRSRVVAGLVAGLVALTLAGGCTSRVGGPPPTPESPESSEPAESSVGAVDLAVPVELSPVVGQSPSGAPSPTPGENVAPPASPATSGSPSPSASPSASPSSAPSVVPDADGVQYLLGEPFLTIERIEGGKVEVTNEGQWVINLSLTDDDAEVFGDWTTGHVGEQAALVVDGEVLFAPSIQSPITGGEVQITGDYTRQEARDLLNRITGR